MRDLQKYPDHERQFNEYEMSCLRKLPRSYYANIVQKFFMNYFVILEKDFQKD